MIDILEQYFGIKIHAWSSGHELEFRSICISYKPTNYYDLGANSRAIL